MYIYIYTRRFFINVCVSSFFHLNNVKNCKKNKKKKNYYYYYEQTHSIIIIADVPKTIVLLSFLHQAYHERDIFIYYLKKNHRPKIVCHY